MEQNNDTYVPEGIRFNNDLSEFIGGRTEFTLIELTNFLVKRGWGHVPLTRVDATLKACVDFGYKRRMRKGSSVYVKV